MHIKIVPPGAWDFHEPTVREIKIASNRRLHGHDFGQLKKLAGEEFAEMVRKVAKDIDKDEVPAHTIALGASETWGWNRNADRFNRKCCQKYAQTFVTHAYPYRNHVNKDPKRSYGRVKLAYFNPKMDRVELLTLFASTKKAADRNGGLVADWECEKLAKGEDIPVSMAAHVPYDVCDLCGNKAKTRADYCTEDTCKYAGCKAALGKLYDDGAFQGVDNPIATWFDISSLGGRDYHGRPADRTAYAAKVDYLSKAASDDSIWQGGSKMAADLDMTLPVWSWDASGIAETFHTLSRSEFQTLKKLARIEERIHESNTVPLDSACHLEFAKLAFVGGPQIQPSDLPALAAHRILLPLPIYGFVTGYTPSHAKEAQALLPGVFRRAVMFDEFDTGLSKVAESANWNYTHARDSALRKFIVTQKHAIGLDAADCHRRVKLAAVRDYAPVKPIKVASLESFQTSSPQARQLAMQFAAYTVKAAAITSHLPGHEAFFEVAVNRNYAA